MSDSAPEMPRPLPPAPVVIPIEPVPDVWEALQAVKSLHSVIVLESALQREGVGRYSFLTADPVEVIEHPTVAYGTDPFAELRLASASFRVESHANLPPFQGGTAGLLSYELGAAWERLPRPSVDEFQIPWLSAGIYDWVLAWDHVQGAAWLVCQGYPETEPSRRLAAAELRAEQILTLLRKSDVGGTGLGESAPIRQSVSPGIPQFAAPGLPGLTSNFSYEGYLQAISRVIEYIRAGDIFQANLSQR